MCCSQRYGLENNEDITKVLKKNIEEISEDMDKSLKYFSDSEFEGKTRYQSFYQQMYQIRQDMENQNYIENFYCTEETYEPMMSDAAKKMEEDELISQDFKIGGKSLRKSYIKAIFEASDFLFPGEPLERAVHMDHRDYAERRTELDKIKQIYRYKEKSDFIFSNDE